MKKDLIFCIINSSNELEAYSDNIKFISQYYKRRDKRYKLISLSKKKFYKKYIDVEEKELIECNNSIIIKENKDYLDHLIDDEYYSLANTIEYIKTLNDKFNLSEKELKKLNKANDILKELFLNFEEYHKGYDTLLVDNDLIREFKKQDDHLKGIYREFI